MIFSKKETKAMNEELERELPIEDENQDQEIDKVDLLLKFIEENAIAPEDVQEALAHLEKANEPKQEEAEKLFGMKFLDKKED